MNLAFVPFQTEEISSSVDSSWSEEKIFTYFLIFCFWFSTSPGWSLGKTGLEALYQVQRYKNKIEEDIFTSQVLLPYIQHLPGLSPYSL